MMTSTGRSSLKRAIAIAVIAAGAASPSWAAPNRSNDASETGQQGDLVNRPGCWTATGYDSRVPCEFVGER